MTRGIIIFTIVEALTLIGWLSINVAVLAAVVLFGGLLIEHIVSWNCKNNVRLTNLNVPFGPIIVVAAVETVAWSLWISAADPWVGAATLAVLLLIGHALELNVVNSLPLFKDYGGRLVKSLDITAIETIAGVLWLALVMEGQEALGAGILAVLLFVEHNLSARKVIV